MIFVCVVENAFFNHQLYKAGDTVDVDDPELIKRMGGRFVTESDFKESKRKPLENFDAKKEVFTKKQVETIITETASENARLKAELKEIKKTGAKKVGG